MIGIYKITNQINNKVYIGQSVNIRKRFNGHKFAARNGENTHLYNAMRDYGIENFSFEILEECSKEQLDDREIYWIEYYHSTDKAKGYNVSKGGKGFSLYNYEEIYNLWKSGFTCEQIEAKMHCSDCTITQALRAFGVSAQEAKSKVQKKIAVVALDKETEVPLKSFESLAAAKKVLLLDSANCGISRVLNGQAITAYGYKWECLNSNNKPKVEMSDEDFLKGKSICVQTNKNNGRHQKVKRPNREELKALIRKKSFVQIGKDYAVSDNTIRRWCIAYNLPSLKRDINSYTDEQWEKI